MDATRFRRLRELFEELCELDATERANRLNELADPELRDEVERMLRATEDDAFLEPPAEASPAPVPERELPERIGDYRVESGLGEGGFGVVYRARQERPIERTVALKVLSTRRLDESSRLRFEAERSTLARMQHGAIAQVYEAGVTPEGESFLAMELVEGLPITDFCDREKLDVERRLELFLRVTEAVEHAHQRGVVHRDLKPSNILVKLEDGRPQPKVIDFGVAKLIEGESRFDLTLDGMLIGTPGYMSPEQASGEPIDTRTDVHALGVLLFELLTGDLPFGRARISSGDALGALRMLREEEPRRLSTAASQAPEGIELVAARRSLEPGGLSRVLRGDLEWIVRKALAREPDRRYSSASELAADVRRFRRHEPVVAREAEVVYLTRKFMARHRVGVALAAGAIVLTILGVLGLIWALDEVSDARDIAASERTDTLIEK